MTQTEQQEREGREQWDRHRGEAREKSTETLTLFYTNAQSILGKLCELEAIVSEENPDIILLTETWCHTEIDDAALTIGGYQLEPELRRDRNDTRNGIGGGLLVYTKKGIKVVLEPKFEGNDFNQFCAFSVITKERPLQIILAYRPPNSGRENTEELCKLMEDWSGDGILVGDINLPGIDWREKKSRL